MVLDEIPAYLQSEGHGIVGSTIVKASLQSMPHGQVAVIQTAGQGPDRALRDDAGGIVIDRPGIQILVRGGPLDYVSPGTLIQDIYETLDNMTSVTISGAFYHQAELLGMPYPLRVDEQDRWVFVLNAILHRQRE